MIVAELKNYLKQIGTPGTAQANLDEMANVAVEAGFASVWGAYDWRVKRAIETGVTMTADQAYYELGTDFDKLISVRLIHTNTPRFIPPQGEEEFDALFPNPAADNTGVPSTCKIVRHTDGKYRLYWWPIPDSAYSIEVTYDKTGSASAMLPVVPPHMLAAIVASCSALMQGRADVKLAADENARRLINQAIKADGVVSAFSPRQGAGYEWDDWAIGGRRGGSVWDPHSL